MLLEACYLAGFAVMGAVAEAEADLDPELNGTPKCGCLLPQR